MQEFGMLFWAELPLMAELAKRGSGNRERQSNSREFPRAAGPIHVQCSSAVAAGMGRP